MFAPPVLVARLTVQLLAATGCPLHPALEIRHVHVIDVRTGGVNYNATLTIDDGRICEITDAGMSARSALQRIEGRGRYALPGLWSNPTDHDDTYRLLGYGITQVLDGAPPNAVGADLYDELQQASAVGVNPLQALQALTWSAAQRANVADSGLLAAGFEASVILLEENPLEDIGHLRSISMVIQRGQPHGLVELARARAGRPDRWQPFVR